MLSMNGKWDAIDLICALFSPRKTFSVFSCCRKTDYVPETSNRAVNVRINMWESLQRCSNDTSNLITPASFYADYAFSKSCVKNEH